MIGSPLRRAVAFAAALSLLLLAWEQWTLSDLRTAGIARLDRSLERTAHAVAAQVGDEAIADADPARLAELVRRAADVTGVRVTLIDRAGVVRADSEVYASHLASIENHGGREEVLAVASGGVGRASRRSDTVGRELRYVAVPGAGGGAVRVSDDLSALESSVAFARRHTLALIAVTALGAAALLQLFDWMFHRRPLREVRRMAEEVAQGRLDARAPRTSDSELSRIAQSIQRTAAQLRSRLREVTQDEQQLRAVLEAMVEGVLVVDARGVILLANFRLRDLFEIHGEIVGRPLLEGVRNADLDAILSEAASTHEAVGRMVTLADARQRTLQVLAAPFPGEGERVGTVAVCHDTTELMRLEEVRRDFVANASHELRTPLAAIRGFAETLLESASLSPEDQNSYLEVINRHALRLSNIVEDLLELSTIESRTSKLEIAAVHVRAVAEAWIADSQLRLQERHIEVTTHVEGSPIALADARAVDQILGNLLDNAMKYTESGGSIAVTIEERLGRVRVSIADTGIGIPPEHAGRIFERFYRVDRARSRALGGTGLGLSIVKHLVQAMGGDISVQSEVDRGSTFTFSLPLAGAGGHGAARSEV
jgi:two-component system phosphate regulon sensor histidine kinase PhoR